MKATTLVLSVMVCASACARFASPSATAQQADKIRLQNAERQLGNTPRGKEVVKAGKDSSVKYETKEVALDPAGKAATTTGTYTLNKEGQARTGSYTAHWQKTGNEWTVDRVELAEGQAANPTDSATSTN